MNAYDRALNSIFGQLRAADEKDRRAQKLGKTRSSEEAKLYRTKFDTVYSDASAELLAWIDSYRGKLGDSPSASFFANEIDAGKYHAFLNDHLVLPHALTKLLDHRTNSGGNSQDLPRMSNLFALAALPAVTKSLAAGQAEKYLRAYRTLFLGLKDLQIEQATFSDTGVMASQFLYWLVYDISTNKPNLNILPDLARATHGSIDDFKSYMVAYWLVRAPAPESSVRFFYSDILPHIH